LQTEPNRTRIITDGTGPYATCIDNYFNETFDPALLSDMDEFNNNGGESLLDAQVECSAKTFSVRYQY